MKQMPSNIKVLYDAHLKNKEISKSAHFHYQKWLRYYLDFCDKYHLNQLKKENVVHFIKKLKDKKQTAQQQKQAYHAISLFYELVVEPINSDKVALLKNKDEKLATRKDSLKLTSANWAPVYDGLISEIKLRHYSPKTLKSYRSWVRHFQNDTRGNEKPRQRSSGITFMTAPPDQGAIKKGINGNPFEIDKRIVS